MADQIGATTSSTSVTSKSALSQEDFLKLFLAELNFQDPMEPLNNREFLAQMAQFSSLEQARLSVENTQNLVFMNSTSQSVSLLGKSVRVAGQGGGEVSGRVTAVNFTANGPVLTVNGADYKLSQVIQVAN